MTLAYERCRSLNFYKTVGSRFIEGWFSRVDAELFSTLLLFQRSQGILGAGAEIGVHHGKSFIAICLALGEDERAFCLDVFDDQHLNIDNSGKGSRAILRKNLARYGIGDAKAEITKASSLGFASADILNKVGPLRFISIDGGHWSEIVENDLELARQCAAPGQIIAVDDFLSVDWPGVTEGFLNWYRKNGGDYCPFAVSRAKLYICHGGYSDIYKRCLSENPLLRYNTKKHAAVLGFETPIINGPYPGFRGLASAYLRKYNPDMHKAARARLSRAA